MFADRQLRASDWDSRTKFWVAILGGFSLAAITYAVSNPLGLSGLDFQAFWCAAHGLIGHFNPYLNQPLHQCEAAHSPAYFEEYRNNTIPAPLPPYGLALLIPLSLIPFQVARIIWLLGLFIAAIFAGVSIGESAKMPISLSIPASILAILGPSLFVGALAPIPIALTLWAALAMRRARWNLATFLLALALIEPHMMLPVFAAVFLFVPQMRLRLAGVAIGGALLSIAAVGPAVVASYFLRILPQHAQSEAGNLSQFSLTVFMYRLGIKPDLSVKIGTLQYAVCCVTSVFLARELFRKTGEIAFLLFVPAAFAVIGGSYVHLSQIAMTTPLACMLVRRHTSAATLIVLVMLAIPTESLLVSLPLTVFAMLISALIVAHFIKDWRLVVGSSFAVLCTVGALILLLFVGNKLQSAGGHPYPPRALVHITDPGTNASASLAWAQYSAAAVIHPWIWWPEKMLTILPLLGLISLTVRSASETGRFQESKT